LLLIPLFVRADEPPIELQLFYQRPEYQQTELYNLAVVIRKERNWISYEDAVQEYNQKLYKLKQKQIAERSKLAISQRSVYENGWGRGHCTSYVAEIYGLKHGSGQGEWRGNAKEWLSQAEKNGYQVKESPEIGAIYVSNESQYGHVAVVKAVNNDGTITITEMNYKGVGVVSERTVDQQLAKGYIEINKL